MATSSFTKDFTLNTKKAMDSFEKIISSPAKTLKIDRTLTSADKQRYGEARLKQMLSR